MSLDIFKGIDYFYFLVDFCYQEEMIIWQL